MVRHKYEKEKGFIYKMKKHLLLIGLKHLLYLLINIPWNCEENVSRV